jgi:hypothetical protein
MRVTTALSLACSALLRAAVCEAQSPQVAPRHELSISAGLGHSDRLDQVVSPSRFAGPSVNGTIAYAGLFRGARLRVGASGAAGTFSASAEQRSDERVTEGTLHLSMFPATGIRVLGAAVSAGLDVQAATSLIAHRFTDPDVRTMSYVFGTLTIGPSLLVERSIGAGTVVMQLSVPVAGIVAQPYSAWWSARTPLEIHFATIASLRSAQGQFTYQSAPHRGLSLLYQYGLTMMRYEHVLPVRGLSHSVAIGVARQL